MNGRTVSFLLMVGLVALFPDTLFAQERWGYRYNGPGNYLDGAHSITMGSDGHIYAAGESEGSGTLSVH